MFEMPSIKREGQTMLNMCMEQCEGVYLINEIERLREQAHYHYENGLKKDVEIERLRKDYALAWENHLLHEQIFVLTEAKIERLQEALQKVCNSLDDNLPAIMTKNIALAALGLPLREMKESE